MPYLGKKLAMNFGESLRIKFKLKLIKLTTPYSSNKVVFFPKKINKKSKKYFRSVIKLDKNFSLYVHGDRDNIEKGFDEEKGMNNLESTRLAASSRLAHKSTGNAGIIISIEENFIFNNVLSSLI